VVTVATNLVAGTRIDNSFFDWDHGTFVAPNARQVARAQARAAEMGIEPSWKGPGRDVRAVTQDQPESMAPVTGSEALHEK
jgi:hypothetical protein